jgi:protein SCO1/2
MRPPALVILALALGACAPLGAAPTTATAPALTKAAASFYAAPWSFHDERGEAVRLDRWRGAPLLVTAFFTSCATRCPHTVAELKKLDAALERTGRRVPVVLVTLDPETDTPERLQRWKHEQRLPDNWHLLRGEKSDTRALVRLLDVHPAYDVGHIDHDVKVVRFDGEGRVTGRFDGWDLSGAVGP